MNKAFKIYSIVFSVVLITSVLGFLYVRYSLERPNYSGLGNKDLRIEPGMTTSQIADMLDKNGLVNSPTLFSLYVRFKKINLQAGSYQTPSDLSIIDLANFLTKGTDDVRLTFVEGLRSEEMAELAKKSLSSFDANAFVSEVKSKKLEGRLFPDTYLVTKTTDALQLVKLLSETFAKRIEPLNIKVNKGSLTENEVIIMASILEREEPKSEERPTVAGILIKRLKSGEILGVDATTQYEFGKEGNWWPKQITQDMLNSDNPFNTRKKAGLPPSPISNPGLSSVKAVVGYKDSEFNFYLHDKDGTIRYAKTLEEHNSNVAKYLSN